MAIDLTGHSAFQPSERAGLFSVSHMRCRIVQQFLPHCCFYPQMWRVLAHQVFGLRQRHARKPDRGSHTK